MQTLLQDLKHAFRMFRESPGFTATVVAALMLGIGVNAAIFSVVNAVLLKPIPFRDPDTLVQINNTLNGVAAGPAASPTKFMYWRAETDIFEDVAAVRNYALNYTGGDTPEQLSASQVSEAFFRVYDAPIIRGRPFTAEEDLPGGPKVAVISYGFWQRRLGGAADVIGRTLPLSGDTYTIVGVTGPDYDLSDFGGNPDLWVPFQLDPNTADHGNFFLVGARLKPRITLAEAKARLEASAAGFRERYPGALGPNGGFTVLTAQEAIIRGPARTGLWVMLGAVGFVLLIACANVANLLLVRATARRREIAIRSALGAGRGRIARQLLTESVVLALIGGVLGLFAGYIGMRALLAVNTAGLPRLGPGGSLLGLDWRVVAFTLGLSLLTGILFGLAPALVGSRTDLNTVIKDSGSRSGSGFRQNKTRSVLVAVEVGLAVVLLIGAALLIRTSVALGNVDPGFDPANTLVMHTSLSGSRFQSSASVAETVRNGLERVRAIPGVASAAATCCVPLQGGLGLPFNVVGRPNTQGPFTGGAGFTTSTSGYFDAFGIRVLRGRVFNESDESAAAPPVVVINEALAKQYWSQGLDPLADRLLIGGGVMREMQGEPARQIIGVVASVHAGGLGNDATPMMYVPIAQLPDAQNALISGIAPLAWVVRLRTDSAALAGAVQNEIRAATGLPVVNVQRMEDVISVSTSRQRLNMLLMTIFGGAALLLAAIGIYGLMAYSVQQRQQEIGIRMALGAEARRVRRMVVRQGMLLVVVGLAAGLVGAFFAANVLSAFLFEVKPRDPAVFVAVPVVLVLIALAAVWLPAGRASRVDPLAALRYE
ncbi:MAG TPA: ABC transporter permease [Gammaproteobacteria bacterium]|nr:ABC transporter permease [Gammaproteobacteria bacterium]